MRHLSGLDTDFLHSEAAHSNSNVTLIQIYDQTTAPGGMVRFKSLMTHIENRLDRSPIFRHKLQEVPLGLDYPYWIEDENFDIEYHVRHIALPKPGDWRQFCIQASRIHARALDLNRPLWEIYVMEGLDSFLDLPVGSFALLIKIHHAAVDSSHGADISTLLHDSTPLASEQGPPQPWFPQTRPGKLALLRRASLQYLYSPAKLGSMLLHRLTRNLPTALTLVRDVFGRGDDDAMTRFNSVVSSHRVFDTRRFALADFKRIAALAKGASVNDAVLAVCAGSLRRYLQAKGELPPTSLTAALPIYVRKRGRQPAPLARRPDVSWVAIELGTHIADPLQRLGAVQRHSGASSAIGQALSARELTVSFVHAPTATLALASKLLARASAQRGNHIALANCSIINVPGPVQPLYLAGARMTYFSAIMPIADGMGLALAVTSYHGQIVIAPTSCRYLMPDPEFFGQCLRESFQEYLALADAALPRVRRRSASASGKSGAPARSAQKAARRPRPGPGGRQRSTSPSG
ncbi:MAG: wax ester/triacylglycerol synthase family O-acyltransferase [Rhodoferax sp.]